MLYVFVTVSSYSVWLSPFPLILFLNVLLAVCLIAEAPARYSGQGCGR